MRPIGGELVTTITSPSCWGTHFLYLSNLHLGTSFHLIIPCLKEAPKQSEEMQMYKLDTFWFFWTVNGLLIFVGWNEFLNARPLFADPVQWDATCWVLLFCTISVVDEHLLPCHDVTPRHHWLYPYYYCQESVRVLHDNLMIIYYYHKHLPSTGWTE